MAASRSAGLRALAQRLADALPSDLVEEVVLTGSVSRGMADDASDVEILVVTRVPLALEDGFRMAGAAGLTGLGTWGAQGGPTHHVSGRAHGESIELIWWSRRHAEAQVEAVLTGATPSTADALVHGVPLRTRGRLAAWQRRLRDYPPELAAAQVEEAALPWGGFAPEGLLTLVRPRDRLALTEWLVDGADRVLAIVFAINGVWRPTTKRLAERLAPLATQPDRLADRLQQPLTDADPRRALLAATELQRDAVLLAPRGPNVDRARAWLTEGAAVLRAADGS